MAARGSVSLEWTLTAATAGPRFERWLTLSDEGRRVVASSGAASASVTAPAGGAAPVPSPAPAPRLGPRQRALLDDIAAAEAAGEPGLAGAVAAHRHGSGTATSLARRGLAVAEVRERPRRPLARRKAGRRGTRPGIVTERRPSRKPWRRF